MNFSICAGLYPFFKTSESINFVEITPLDIYGDRKVTAPFI
jgi:hypothetical protein